jgi:hypothetical protein
MKRNPGSVTHAVLTPLRSAWEDTVSAGLRQATDVELLWMLDEIQAQLGERTAAWSGSRLAADECVESPDEIPDWDDKSPEELEAIIRDLEEEPDDTPHTVPAPHRPAQFARRGNRCASATLPSNLRCEELEPRLPPSAAFLPRVELPWLAAAATTWHQEELSPASGTAYLGSVQTPESPSATLWDEEVADRLVCALVA